MGPLKSAPAVSGIVKESNHEVSPSADGSEKLSAWESGSPPAPDWDKDVTVPCRNVRVFNGIPAGCGECDACRIRKAKVWGVRIQLEMAKHAESVFTTLTYDDHHLPPEGSLHKSEFSAFIKRLRRRVEDKTGRRFRFFACGEYGSRTGRAHYHAILFGVGMWSADLINSCWQRGFTHTLPADGGAGPYVAGYVVKKLKKVDRYPREPEFILMSRRPGIGAHIADSLADLGLTSELPYDEYGDIVSSIKKGPYTLGISGYIQNRTRTLLTGSANVPSNKKQAKMAKVYAMQQAAQEVGQRPDFTHSQKALQIEQKFFRTRHETF